MAGPYSVKFDANVPLMLRDGTITYADICRPDAPGRYPGLLLRTPYGKGSAEARTADIDVIAGATRGYAVVLQDVRGRYSSDGEFYPFVDEINDGYDSVEWVASQPWCSGKVGMFGGSYCGASQWLAAKAKPPSLACIAPSQTASDYHEGWVWQGGAFGLGYNLWWTLTHLAAANWDNISMRLNLPVRLLDLLLEAKDDIMAAYRHLPMQDLPDLEGAFAPSYYDWLAHPEYDDYWKRICIEESHPEIAVPAISYGGWYDGFLGGTLRNFSGMRELGPTEDARSGQRLIVGPWTHGGMANTVQGEYDFGSRSSGAALDIQGLLFRFYDLWLKGEDNGVAGEKPVRIYVMGENVWRLEDEWPLSRAAEVNYYIRSGGRANTLNGDGWLSPESPGAEPIDDYVYNPIDPVPTRGGPLCFNTGFIQAGAFDQRPIEARPDVLVYTTPPLEEAMEVTGPLTVTLYASSSARDTDYTAKLVEVAPSGYARNLAEGIIRVRYRTPREPASPIEFGQVYEYKIDLWATSNLFRKGYQIRLEISSSNFPRFDRNTNTGEAIGADAGFVSALQTVYHTSEYPSHITLPVVPRG